MKYRCSILVNLLRDARNTECTVSMTVATLGCVMMLGLTGCGSSSSGDMDPVDARVASVVAAQQISLTLSATSTAQAGVADAAPSAGLVVTQALNLSASGTGSGQILWSISPSTGNGKFSSTTTESGVTTTFTAPSVAGLYTITATSGSQLATLKIGVTDLAGVLTYHNDSARDGANTQEYALTSANVNSSTFDKLFSCPLDGAVVAQPLWVPNLTVNGAKHNVVFVATENDSLYAFDADMSPCNALWSISLIDTAHGGLANETPFSFGSISFPGEIGVHSTPVIDASRGAIYLVSKSMFAQSGTTVARQNLHAISMSTGAEMTGSPVLIKGTYPGTGDGGSSTTFDPNAENQRAGLALINNVIYICWAAANEGVLPYYGWVMGYQYTGSGFWQTGVLNVTPNAGFGGIWMSEAGPSSDSSGNIYLITGNGQFDANNAGAPSNDYGDSLLELASHPTTALGAATSLTVTQYFTPSDQTSDYGNDFDFGSGGAALVANVNSATTPHLAIVTGKDGYLYVINRDKMGGYGDSNALQKLSLGRVMTSTPAFWNGTLYLVPRFATPLTFTLTQSGTTPSFVAGATARTPTSGFGYGGATPSISANGTSDGILWAIDTGVVSPAATSTCQDSTACQVSVLRAYDATTLTELWNSTQATGYTAISPAYNIRFRVPTIANGKVYVTTQTAGSGASASELDVYGLK